MTSSTPIEIIYAVQNYIGYVTYIIFVLGILGNLMNMLVFTTLKVFRNNQCVFYLITESIANIIQLFIFFFIRMLTEINVTDPANYILFWCKFRGMMITLCTVISFSTICFAACDQYLSTSHQFYLRQMSTIKLARILIFTTVCVSTLHTIPFSINLVIQGSVCTNYNPGMSNYLSYFYYTILTGALPIVIASSFSILAFRNVRRIVRRQVPIVRRRLDRQLTAMVLVRVIAFVIMTLPFGVQRTYNYQVKITPANPLSYAINSLALTFLSTLFNLNYAVTIKYFSLFI
jgi:hypothetical protein